MSLVDGWEGRGEIPRFVGGFHGDKPDGKLFLNFLVFVSICTTNSHYQWLIYHHQQLISS